MDLNHGPPTYKIGALTPELHTPIFCGLFFVAGAGIEPTTYRL
jgi:hypothetical protein